MGFTCLNHCDASGTKVFRYNVFNDVLHLFYFFLRYVLRPPSDSDVKSYVDNVTEALLLQKDKCNDIILKFSEIYGIKADSLLTAVKERTACRLLSKKMIHDALLIRKKHVGILLKSLQRINAIQLASEYDFLEGVHTVSSEPFFYDTGYKTTAPKQVTIVDHVKTVEIDKLKLKNETKN